MKIIILIGALLHGFVQFCYSQDCKYVVNTEDKFTKLKVQETESIELCQLLKNKDLVKIKNIGMVLRKEGDKRFFTLVYTISGSGGIPRFVGNGQSKLILLLDNNSTIDLDMTGLMSDQKTNWGGTKGVVATHFEMSEENYLKLLANSITDIRALAMVNPFDFKIKEEVKTNMYFNCIK